MHNKFYKKKICFVTTLPVTLRAFVLPQAKYLLQNGWDVTLLCAEDQTFFKDIPNGARYIPMPFNRGIDFFGIPKSILSLYRLFKNEHFNIVQYSTPNAAFYTSIAAWLAGIQVRLYAQWGIRYVGLSGLVRSIFKQLELWCCRCSTIIEPDSDSNLEFSVKEGLYARDKSRVIWNGSACGVNLARFDISQKNIWRTAYRNKLGYDSHHYVIGFVGSVQRDKGCSELISACRSFFGDIPDARLLLIGPKGFYTTIDKDSRDWIESSKQVQYIPPTNEVPQYMACMDIFTLPSHREGFGMVVIEAEAMGVPVVVSDVPGPIDAMRHEETGLVVPVKNAEKLAQAFLTLRKDTDKRLAFGSAAAAFARENFDQKKFLQFIHADKERLLAESNMQI